MSKWLIRSDSSLYTFNNATNEVTILSESLSSSLFNSRGSDSPPNSKILSKLANPRIMCHGSTEHYSKAIIHANVKSKTVVMKNSEIFNSSDVLGFKSVDIRGIGDIRVSFSFDGGVSWWRYATTWQKDSDIVGTSLSTINNLSTQEWDNLFNELDGFTMFKLGFVFTDGAITPSLNSIKINYKIKE